MKKTSYALFLILALGAGCAGNDGTPGINASPCEVTQDANTGDTTIQCPGSDPVVIQNGQDGQSGQDGQDGEACTAERNDEAGTITVTCPGSDPVVIQDGQDGQDGQDSEPCTTERDDEAGTTTVTCPGSDPVIIQDGQNGQNGQDGDPCSVERDDEAGTTTVTCPGSDPVVIQDAEDGQDGDPCSVERDDEAGTTTVTCPESDPVVIQDGQDGQSCSVTDNDDGTATITCDDGTSVTYNTNNLPQVGSAYITPTSPTTNDAITCNVTGSVDSDGDSVTLSYAWYLNGAETDNTDASVPSDNTELGQEWRCEVTPSDGLADGAPISSASVTVGNSAPEITSVTVNPTEPSAGDALTCDAVATDADDDSLVYTYAWTIFGVESGYDTQTISPGITQGNDVWACTVTAFDGTASSVSVTSESVTILDTSALFWVVTNSSINRLGLRDLTQTTLHESAGFDLTTDGEYLYWDQDGSNIVRSELDGSDVQTIMSNLSGPYGLSYNPVDNKLYWSAFNSGNIQRADLDGSNIETIAAISSPSGLDIDTINNKIYVITYNNTAIYRLDFDGGNRETLATSVGGQGCDIEADPANNKIYYVKRDGNIFARDLDGSNPTTLVADAGRAVQGIAFDEANSTIYWSDLEGNIRSANTPNGDNETTVATDIVGNVWGMTFKP